MEQVRARPTGQTIEKKLLFQAKPNVRGGNSGKNGVSAEHKKYESKDRNKTA
jgi:hypothetical protein